MKSNFNIRNRYVLLGDLFFILLSAVGAYILRLEFLEVFENYYISLLWLMGLSLVIKPVVYFFFGLYRKMWIYASIDELKLIFFSVTLSSILLSVTMLLLFRNRFFTSFPRSSLIIDWVLSLLFVGGLRFSLRVLFEGSKSKGNGKHDIYHRRRILIVGAGDMGAMIVKEMQKNKQLKSLPIGFLDDDPDKQKQQLFSVPVIGRVKDLSRTISSKKVDEVIIAMPSASGKIVRDIINVCRKRRIPFRTMPNMLEILGGNASVKKLRQVDISDLLRRNPVQQDDTIVGEILSKRNVLVTGAGGSIGRELCRQIARWSPEKLVLLGHGENSIFETYLTIKDDFPNLPVYASIADIRNISRIEQEIKKHTPDVIFHTAAHKHVPLMESNIEECILNNVKGTQNIIQLAEKYAIQKLVYISTDKAVQPISVMGGSKRIAEMLVLDAAERLGASFSVVRFGNVLGSRGSVVPLFKRQIEKGGPVTVTHPDMKRYFMTIPEAVYLVLQAAGMGKGGETFILNMGKQIKIVDLAEDLIRLSGFEPGRDVEIIYTGVREGEKLSEDLWNAGRRFRKTAHPEIFCEEGHDVLSGESLDAIVEKIIQFSNNGSASQIIEFLNAIIPNAEISQKYDDDLTFLIS